MNKFLFGVMVGALLMYGAIQNGIIEVCSHPRVEVCSTVERCDDCNKGLSDWEIFILATVKTESDFNFEARGSHNDLGILQETPIWVKEVNRIIGKDMYSHEEALDPRKALEMYKVMQDHYNPSKCINTALNLHNPAGSSVQYSERVLKNLDWIVRYEEVRQTLQEVYAL